MTQSTPDQTAPAEEKPDPFDASADAMREARRQEALRDYIAIERRIKQDRGES